MRVQSDGVASAQAAVSSAALEGSDSLRGNTVWTCFKYGEDACQWVRNKLGLADDAAIASALLESLGVGPDLVEVRPGNLMLNEGIQEILDLMIGAGGTPYSNANADIGVGDSTTAEAATQTDLQASTNKLFKAMNSSYPQRTAQTVEWRSDFTTAEANFAWQEWSVRNGSTRNRNANRKVQSLGTKTTGTWTLAAQLTLS